MKSQRFEFLRAKRPVLADLAGFAERYAHDDPASSLLAQRSFIERVVAMIFEAYRLPPPPGDQLVDLMAAEPFRASVPQVVRDKLHLIREGGHQGTQPRGRRSSTLQLGLDCLAQLFDVAGWFHLAVDGGAATDLGTYAPPSADRTEKEGLERLRLAEAQHRAALSALEKETRERLSTARRTSARADPRAGQQTLERGEQIASSLRFDEETTRRRLIDVELKAAGWDVAAEGKSTDEVGQEVEVATMPTASGKGFIDYVLYADDGKPLAVVEAKRAAKDADIGAAQAAIYAGCLEKETGVRPVIFYTNGSDIDLIDDAQGRPRRKVYGFYSKDSLEHLVHQRSNRKDLAEIEPSLAIADRMYQLEAIRRVCERFSANHRQALIVQATGTGKTRVAISLCDVLMRAGWAKRILFLCDRKELRKQADKVFKEFIPDEPRVVVSRTTANDRNKRIYLATYPAMMKCYESFDVGFFDLVIADESHRSLYAHYRVLFQHFDALQLGLTATPVELVGRNTYALFGCHEKQPTSAFGFPDAIEHDPPYLVPFRVRICNSVFRQAGIRYAELSEAQREQVDDQDARSETTDIAPKDIDRTVFNRDTTRAIWQTLMDEGIREATGSHVGKTIVFARSRPHAVHLAKVFEELYPQYGSTFCKVITHEISHVEHLIDDFKDPTHALTIAISVDMLDTGIDVPEVVNLVFAKAVRSKVKFLQMLGRGTRLCPNLSGPGRDKTEFLVFDHGDNFRFFDEDYEEASPSAPSKPLLQQLFDTRIELGQAALDRMDDPMFAIVVALLVADVRDLLKTKSIDVRDRRRQLEQLADASLVRHFAAVTQADLRSIAGPLQHQRNIRGHEYAYRFDLLVARLQLELLRGGPEAPSVHDLRARMQIAVEQLTKNLDAVKAKATAITQVRSTEFWAGVEAIQLEALRKELRGIMQYQRTAPTDRVAPLYLDIDDSGQTIESYVPRLDGLDRIEYKRRVQGVLSDHFSDHEVVLRVRAGEVVEGHELAQLAQQLREVDDGADVERLTGREGAPERSLLTVFRALVGIDMVAVQRVFSEFVERHPRLDARQLRFLRLLHNHIAHNGGIEIERLYEPPFTTVHAESIDGVFGEPDVDELLAILRRFEPQNAEPPDGTAQTPAS